MTRIVTFSDGFTSESAPVVTGLATETKQDDIITELNAINTNQHLSLVNSADIDFSVSNVDNTAFVELIADTGGVIIRKIQVFMSSGEPLRIGFGAAASEVSQGFIIPGGNGFIDMEIPINTRVSLKAVNAVTVSDGVILVNFLG